MPNKTGIEIVIRGPHNTGRTTVARLIECALCGFGFNNVTVEDTPEMAAGAKADLIDRVRGNQQNPVRIRVEFCDWTTYELDGKKYVARHDYIDGIAIRTKLPAECYTYSLYLYTPEGEPDKQIDDSDRFTSAGWMGIPLRFYSTPPISPADRPR